ncbi:MAG: hypothetical protein AAF447_00585 [Myxococcota bacterium]
MTALDEACSILAVTGPGGIGKTRFGVELSGRLAERMGGVLVRRADLSETSTSEGLRDALAALLEVPRTAERLPEDEAFARTLRDAPPTLIIVDSPERVRDELAALLGRWTAGPSAVRWLVCSRVAPEVPGARRIELGPLAARDARDLFLDRASLQRWDFEIAADEETALRGLLERLDGVPLAIELVAARAPTLGLDELRGRLGTQLDLLRNRRPGTTPRHLTLRATAEWSLALLPLHARKALLRAAAFRGSFDFPAFEAVVAPEGGAGDALELLETLLDHSLLRTFAGRDGGRRFRLYEVVRELASEQLEAPDAADERDGAVRRHGEHFVARFEATTTPNGPSYLLGLRAREERLLDDVDNLMAGFERMEGRNARLRARAALQAARVLFRRGADDVLFALLDAGAEAAGRAADPGLRGRLLLARACAERSRQRRDVSPLLDEADALAAKAGDASLEGAARWHRALAASDRCDFEEALAELAAARPLLARHGDRDGELFVDVLRAVALGRSGRTAEALASCARAISAARTADHAHGLASALRNRAALLWHSGAYEEALESGREALAVQQPLGDTWGELMTRVVLCAVASSAGAFEEARRHGDAGRDLVSRSGFVRPLQYPEQELGWLELACERDDEAAARFEAVLGEAGRRGHALQRAEALTGRAVARLVKGAGASARGDLSEALAIKARGPLPVYGAQVEQALMALSHALEGERRAAAGWVAVTREQLARCPHAHAAEVLGVVEHALDGDDALPPVPRTGMSPVGRAARRAFDAARAGGAGQLVIAPELAWVDLPDGTRLPLARRPVARRIVAALLEARRDSPGQPLPTTTLVGRVWPADRSRKEDLSNRLWVAVAALRRAGFEGLLRTDRVGYLLDPSVPLAEARAPEAT